MDATARSFRDPFEILSRSLRDPRPMGSTLRLEELCSHIQSLDSSYLWNDYMGASTELSFSSNFASELSSVSTAGVSRSGGPSMPL